MLIISLLWRSKDEKGDGVMDQQGKRVTVRRFIYLVLLTVLLLVMITPFDYDWTLFLIEHRLDPFAHFMQQSIFVAAHEFGGGYRFGGGDVYVFFFLLVLVLYFVSYHVARLAPWRAAMGFIVLSTLSGGIALIHTLKHFIGRPRPYDVMVSDASFAPWYQWSENIWYVLPRYQSFPSGHTATAALSLVIAYLLLGHPLGREKSKRWGWLALGVAVVYGVAMLISRSMVQAHWLSDGLASVMLLALWLYVLYFWVLRVPQQQRYQQRFQQAYRGPLYFEGVLGGLSILVYLGSVEVWRLISASVLDEQTLPTVFWGYAALLLVVVLAMLALYRFHHQRLFQVAAC